jgi:single-stranded DNA-binding protein
LESCDRNPEVSGVIDGLIGGRIHGTPVSRVGKSGRPFVTAHVRVSLRDGESIFANVICFAQDARTALAALKEGDSVCLSGELTPRIYQPKDGGSPRPALDMLAHAVLTEYHVARRRKAMQTSLPFNDALPAEGL